MEPTTIGRWRPGTGARRMAMEIAFDPMYVEPILAFCEDEGEAYMLLRAQLPREEGRSAFLGSIEADSGRRARWLEAASRLIGDSVWSMDLTDWESFLLGVGVHMYDLSNGSPHWTVACGCMNCDEGEWHAIAPHPSALFRVIHEGLRLIPFDVVRVGERLELCFPDGTPPLLVQAGVPLAPTRVLDGRNDLDDPALDEPL
jgi:hypothetical protein